MEKIIDGHMHFSAIEAFHTAAHDAGVVYSRDGYAAECADAGVVACVCMGLAETQPHKFVDSAASTPMLADLDAPPPGLALCMGINPHTLDAGALQKMRSAAQAQQIVGFKIFAGYYHKHVYDAVYALASEFGLPVAIHTGDTYSEQAQLTFSHPLGADRVAVKYRDVRFVLCHMGDPWVMDACELAYKNRNVYVDISGLLAGPAAHIERRAQADLLMNHFRSGLVYLDNYKKVIFGTDWPLVPLGAYIDFCKQLVPQDAWADVFYTNALDVYNLERWLQ